MGQSNFKTLISFTKGHKKHYLVAIIGAIIAALIALFPPYILGGTIDSIIGDSAIENSFQKWIFTLLGGREHLQRNLYLIAALILALNVFTGIGGFLKVKYANIASEGIARTIRRKLFNHLQKLPFAYHSSIDTGDVIQRCTSDVETIRAFLSMQLIEVANALFTIAFILTSMVLLNPILTLYAVIFIPFLVVFSYIFFKKIQKVFMDADTKEGIMSNVLQENLNGVRVVKAFGREAHEIEKFDEKNKIYAKSVEKIIRAMAVFWSISDLCSLLQLAILLIAGVTLTIKGKTSIGVLVTFMTYESMILWPVRQLGRILSEFGKTLVSVTRIKEIIDEPIEELDEPKEKPSLDGSIDFSHVSFGYNEKNHVLKDITFSVNKGETVAILGPTGSGKSTLVHLLQRLFDYEEGHITINGHELRTLHKKWLRQNIGIVLQEPFLFSKTIKENLTLINKEASEDHIEKAAKIANFKHVIEKFDQGYETMIGEKGVTLSGGQKQRLAIARTIMKEKPILIFDDSLSAVDTKTDAIIRKELGQRAKNTTTIIISHRINTLMEADKILVLENGRITQQGKHDKLIQEEGLYKRIYEIQHKERRSL